MSSSQDGKSSKVVRPLGNLEKMKSAMHLLRQHCGTTITCCYTLPKEFLGHETLKATEDFFYRAVALTILEHPLMQVGLSSEDSSSPAWVKLDSLDLNKHVTWETVKPADDYNVRFETTVQTQLDSWFVNLETQPGWRISVLRRQDDPGKMDVIFCWHHAHFDGTGGKLFHQTLLRSLNDVRAKQGLPEMNGTVLQLQDVAGTFPPPIEKLRRIPVSLGFTLATVWKELKPAFLSASNPADATWAPIRVSPRQTTSRTILLDNRTLKDLLEASRMHKTTLTGLLNALVLTSLALQLESKEVDVLSSATALDLRRFMPLAPEGYPWHDPHKTMDNEVSLQEHHFDADLIKDIRAEARSASLGLGINTKLEAIVWSVAARARQEIQQRLEADMENDPVGLMDYVADWRTQMRSKLQKPRAKSWGVTNLGVLDGDAGALDWGIERAVFQLSAETTAAAFHVSAVSVKDGELCVDVGWQKGILDETIGERLASDLEAWMRHLGKAEAE